MEHLSPAQLDQLRARLEQEAAQLQARVRTVGEDIAERPDDGEPGDIEDAAAQEAGRFQASRLLTRERSRLTEVEAALARMDDGSYGICEDSDDPIPFRRLELEPTTRFTVEAQAEREREQRGDDPHGDEPIAY